MVARNMLQYEELLYDNLNPDVFESGDTFKVRLTCPMHGGANWDVVVFQGKEAFFPYAKQPKIPCGNNVPIPGAFKLTGTKKATVCIMVDDIPQRSALKAKGKKALLKGSAVCTTLKALKQRSDSRYLATFPLNGRLGGDALRPQPHKWPLQTP